MATIYDIAKLCNLSTATVSYVLNGQGDTRKISKRSQERIFQVAQQLNYQPNLSARKLRNASGNSYTVAFYWPTEHFELAIATFLQGINRVLSTTTAHVDVVIRPYTRNYICDDKALLSANTYNAAVIASLGNNDLEFLSQNHPVIPTILVNRELDGYSQVLIDNCEAGKIAAENALRRTERDIGVILNKSSYIAMDARCQSFIDTCRRKGVNLSDNLYYAENSIEDGWELGCELIRRKQMHKVFFCAHDSTTIGLLSAFNQNGIAVGRDVQIIAASTALPTITAHTFPPLTVIDLKMTEIAESSLRLAIEHIGKLTFEPQKLVLHPKIIYRASFPIEQSQ